MADVILESKKTNSGKSGMVVDDNGYHKMVFGALNTYNTNGVFYRVDDINRLTGPKSIVGERISNGVLKAEVNHPDFTGLSGNALLNKILTIDLNNVCAHIKGLEFIDTKTYEPGWSGYPIYRVEGWVKPTGAKAEILKSALENPDENVPFSIRSAVIEKRIGATMVRNVLEISTWDFVFENGVKGATSWAASGIENSSHVQDDPGILCLNGSCIPKLKELVSSGTEHQEDVKKILQGLEEKEKAEKPILYNW